MSGLSECLCRALSLSNFSAVGFCSLSPWSGIGNFLLLLLVGREARNKSFRLLLVIRNPTCVCWELPGLGFLEYCAVVACILRQASGIRTCFFYLDVYNGGHSQGCQSEFTIQDLLLLVPCVSFCLRGRVHLLITQQVRLCSALWRLSKISVFDFEMDRNLLSSWKSLAFTLRAPLSETFCGRYTNQ